LGYERSTPRKTKSARTSCGEPIGNSIRQASFYTCRRNGTPVEKEGVKIKNDAVVDFKKLFWDPAVELGF
jgi:hypothetical protein